VHRRDLLFGAAAMAGALALPDSNRYRAALGQESTPAAGSGPQALDMLRYAPDIDLLTAGSDHILATVADLAHRIATFGVAIPTSQDDEAFGPWLQATTGLILPRSTLNAFGQDWREAFGWDGFQVDRTLEILASSDTAEVYIGRFDQEEIGRALLSGDGGYAEIAIEGATAAWSCAPDGDLDLATTAGLLALGALNNVALLPDGALVAAPTLSAVTRVEESATGSAPSLAENELIRPLLDAQAASSAPLDSAMIVPGFVLMGGVDPITFLLGGGTPAAGGDFADAMATAIAEQAKMPPVFLALVGTTGETPASRACFTLLVALADDAAAAVPVIEERLATGVSLLEQRPWAEIMGPWTVAAVSGEPVVTIEIATERPALWENLIYARDTGFVAW
jgi:hypothetical protein